MTYQESGLDSEFISRQREWLLQMQRDVTNADAAHLSDTAINMQLRDASMPTTRQSLTEGQLAFNKLRMGDIQRALQKIEEGTYGLSDESGEPIPRSRLEVFPDALFTEREQEERELGK